MSLPTATSHRRQHDDAGSETDGMAGQPAKRRFRVKPRGAVVRAGAALTSAIVGELEGGATVVAPHAAPGQNRPRRGTNPLQGFVSRKVSDTLRHGPRRPATVETETYRERTKTVTAVARRPGAFVRHKEQEARRDAGLQDMVFASMKKHPCCCWVSKHKPARTRIT